MPDAVVIGSGPNGLAAAIRLAEVGREVLVLEAQDAPGGAVRTEELTLPGFRHDTFSAVYPATAASPVFARMPLADHGLEWVHPEACFAHPFEDGRAGVLHHDLDATVASLNGLHLGDGDRYGAWAQPLLERFGAIRRTMLAGFPPVGGPLELLARGGPPLALAWLGLLPVSAEHLGRKLFDGSQARAWFYGPSMHGDVPPRRRGGAIAAAYLDLMGHAVGWPSPRGGSQAITDALVAHLRSLGGEVRTGARVVAVDSSAGRVTGVRTADERVAARTVVADVLPHALARLAGDALPGWYASLLKRFRMGPSTVKVDWALDGPIPWTNADARRAGTIHVGGDEDVFLASIDQAQDALPERPFQLLGQQSVADPTRAPEGKHTAWSYTHGPGAYPHWECDLDLHVARMEAEVERYAPGFRDRILARHVLGPADLQRRDENLVRGDVGAGSYVLRQAVFRPVPSLTPYSTPLRGLFLGSAAAFPGGAVHGVAGDAAARAALRARG